jgi:hypothetical protein
MVSYNNSADHQVTQYNVVTGGASNVLNNVAPPSTSGVPLVSNGSSSQPSFTTAVVAGGGTGNTTFTAYSIIAAGTTSTGAFQNVSGVGTAGQVLTSNGASALPTWQPGASVLNYTSVLGSITYTVASTDQFLGASSLLGAVTIKLPNAPVTGRVYVIKDTQGTSSLHNITVTTVGGSVNIDGATSYVISTNFQSINVLFDGVSYEVF